jgi:hypothetical protein
MSNGGGNSKITVSGSAGSQAADATHSADSTTVTVNICTSANYTAHGNSCSAAWAAQTLNPSVTSGTYSATSANNGSGTYFATVTQTDAAGNIGTVTTGPFTR